MINRIGGRSEALGFVSRPAVKFVVSTVQQPTLPKHAIQPKLYGIPLEVSFP